MFIKTFSNSKGGSAKSIDYLLNKRQAEGTAKVLQGDPQITRNIIATLANRKQKVTVGSINIEDKDKLTAEQKKQIIKEFEEMLLPGMRGRYNILWVEHTDKQNLELNFVIPKVDLLTRKALNPYYHARDFARIEMFEDTKNYEYKLSSKKDPSKARTIQGSYKAINLIKDVQELDKELHTLVKEAKIQNRGQMVALLRESGVEVTREAENGISIKMPNSKKATRLKGGIYSEQFTSIASIENISNRAEERAREFNQRDTHAEYARTLKRLKEYTQQRAQELEREYGAEPRTNEGTVSERDKRGDKEHQEHDNHDYSNSYNHSHSDGGNNANNKNNREQIDDRARADTERRIAESRAERERADRAIEEGAERVRRVAEEEPRKIYIGFNQNYKAFREQHKGDEAELRADTQRGTSEEQTAIRAVHADRTIEHHSVKSRITEAYKVATSFIAQKLDRIKKALTDKQIKEVLKQVKEEQEPQRSRGFGYSR